jgi:hypothetical protein
MEKAVEFTFITSTKEELESKVISLSDTCKEKELELKQGRYIGSFRELHFPGDIVQFRATLHIVKKKGFTYEDIYKTINSVQVCSFKTVNL